MVALQDAGLLVSRSQHAAHHHVPYNNNYCIVSGVWKEFLDENKVFEALDENKVFEALEMILFFQLGVRPRSWSEPNFGWIEEIETPSQTTVYWSFFFLPLLARIAGFGDNKKIALCI